MLVQISEGQSKPILYSFRRCPYAIRARMAIYYAGIDVELIEVSLKSKPQSMLDASGKGTVPVLCVQNEVIDESLDIMFWAIHQNDPKMWWIQCSDEERNTIKSLVYENDFEFKACLDKYKYASRFPEYSPEYYRDQCGAFLRQLELRLTENLFLLGQKLTLADVAIFPFIRQFSMVDSLWFETCEYKAVRAWLLALIEEPLFVQVMKKVNAV